MNQILLAIASLEGPPPIHSSSTAAYDWEIQFCRGSEILAKADFQDNGVLIGSVEYEDRSGEIQKLYGMAQEDSKLDPRPPIAIRKLVANPGDSGTKVVRADY